MCEMQDTSMLPLATKTIAWEVTRTLCMEQSKQLPRCPSMGPTRLKVSLMGLTFKVVYITIKLLIYQISIKSKACSSELDDHNEVHVFLLVKWRPYFSNMTASLLDLESSCGQTCIILKHYIFDTGS